MKYAWIEKNRDEYTVSNSPANTVLADAYSGEHERSFRDGER